MTETCLIAGAGPTGLTMAIELTRFGLPVRLIDKAEQPAQWSQALVVQARTLEQFERYGIAGDAVRAGREIKTGRFWSDGRMIASIDLGRIPSRYPYVLILPQNETEQLLTRHLSSLGVEIERNVGLTGFENSENGVTAELEHADGRREQARFRWLVGCDGAHSTVRDALQVPFEGDTVGLQFALGDLHLHGKQVPGDDLEVHLHAGGDVLFVGRLKENLYRVILVLHDEQKNDPERMPELEDFNAAFGRFNLEIRADSAVWRSPFHVNQRKARQYRVKSAFLAGDASHIHSPVGGQGMNVGIQDAANLAWKLAAVDWGASSGLLDSYDEERGAVGDALLRATSLGLDAATASNRLAEVLRDFLIRGITRLDVVQNAIASAIAEVSVDYRDSSVVRNQSADGPLQAGDRMPNASCNGAPGALLEPLRNGQHLLIAVDDAPREAARHLKHTGVLEIQSSDSRWSPPLETLLGRGPRAYLVRPDGYIGYSGTPGGEVMRSYARSVGLG